MNQQIRENYETAIAKMQVSDTYKIPIITYVKKLEDELRRYKEEEFWDNHQIVTVNGVDMVATRPAPGSGDPVELL